MLIYVPPAQVKPLTAIMMTNAMIKSKTNTKTKTKNRQRQG